MKHRKKLRFLTIILSGFIVANTGLSVFSSDPFALAAETALPSKITLGTVTNQWTSSVAPNVSQTKMEVQSQRGPQQIFEMTIKPGDPNTHFESGLTFGKVVGMEQVTKQSQDITKPGHVVIGGINGDFYDMTNGLPIGTMIRNGQLLESYNETYNHYSTANWSAVGFLDNGQAVIGVPHFTGAVTTSSNQTYAISCVNQGRGTDQLVLYTPDFDATTRTNNLGTELVLNNIQGAVTGNGTVTATVAEKHMDQGNLPLQSNTLVLSGQGAAQTFLNNLNLGDSVTLSTKLDAPWDQVKEAIGGNRILVKNGTLATLDPNDANNTSVAPRTAVGIKADGSVFFVVVDGRQPGYSAGTDIFELAQLLKDMGAVDAINLDGGGSSTFVARNPGDAAVSVQNIPSDGSERTVANSLLVVNTAAQGALSQFAVLPDHARILSGSHMSFQAKGLDDAFHPADVQGSPSWSVDGNIGQVDTSGAFTAGAAAGSSNLKAAQGAASGTAPIEVVDHLTDITITPSPITVNPGQSITLHAAGILNGLPVTVDPSLFKWQTTGTIGTVDGAGQYTASASMGTGSIIVSYGSVQTTVAVSVGKMPIIIDDFENGIGNWVKNGARYNSISMNSSTAPEPVRFGQHALKLSYDFKGTVGTSGAYAQLSTPVELDGYPKEVGMWVYGDGKSHWLRSQLRDGANGAIDLNLTDPSPGINWVGWKYVSAPIPPGKILPLKWTIPVRLMETNNGNKTDGAIYVDNIRAVYSDTGEDLIGPTFSNFSPNAGKTIYKNTPNFVASVKDDKSGVDGSSIKVNLDGNPIVFAYDPDTTNITFKSPAALSDGPHTVQIDAADKAGNPAVPSAQWSFTVYTGPDITSPTVKLISPLDGIITRTDKPRIAATITDEYTGVDTAKTKLEVDGVQVTHQYDPASSSIFYTPETKYAAGSQHQMKITTTDKSGNTAIQTSSFTVGAPIGQPKDANHFQMSIIGDGGYFTAGQLGGAADILLTENIARINKEEKTELVAYTGDIVENDTPANYKVAQDSLNNFKFPYVVTIGNHEVSGTNSRANYQQTFGEPTYSYEYGNTEMIGLDSASGDITHSDASQWPWLQDTLNKSQSKNITIFMHLPPDEISADGIDFKTGHGFQNPVEAQKFYDLLGAYKSKNPLKNIIVFDGDLHAYEHKIVQGVDYVITGGGGKYTHVTPEQGGFYHYLNLKADGDQLLWDVIPLLDSITFANVPDYLKKGEQVKLQASGKFMTSINAPITMPIAAPFKREWVSSNPDIASVDSEGTVTGKAPGETIITVKSGWREAQARIVVPTPPKTSFTTDGIIGSDTYNNRNVTVTFSVYDGTAGTGVKQTNYRVNSGGWSTVTGSVYLTNEGVHMIDYFSEDNLGNQEDIQHLTISIDKTTPTFALTVNGTPLSDGAEFQDSQSIMLSLQADDNLSGVAEQTIIVDGKPYVTGSVLDWAGQLGTHVIQTVVKDKAGNISQSVINVKIKTSISAMQQLVERYFASGDLSASLKKQLLEKLKDAQDHFSKGNLKAAIDDLNDFQESISKPNKKKQISDRAKTALFTDSKDLILSWSGKEGTPGHGNGDDHGNESSGQNNTGHDQNKGDNNSR